VSETAKVLRSQVKKVIADDRLMANGSAEHAGATSDTEDLYEEYYPLLHTIVTTRFSIPAEDASGVIHDVLLSYLRSRETIRWERNWLLSAVCNASRGYWARRGEREDVTDSLDSGSSVAEPVEADTAEQIGLRLTAIRILEGLSENDREMLRLHYLEGYTSVEIAERMNLTGGTVRKRLHDGLVRATREYRLLETGNA
jgi:RNA polymerase sigma factor (sigma-70 family)